VIVRGHGNGHIGELAAAFVDDQLDDDQRLRMASHLVWCPPCRQLVEEQQAAKTWLTALREPCTPTRLNMRLLGLSQDSSTPDGSRDPQPAPHSDDHDALFAGVASHSPLDGFLRLHDGPGAAARRLRRAALGGSAMVVIGIGGVFSTTAAPAAAHDPLVPAVSSYLVAHPVSGGATQAGSGAVPDVALPQAPIAPVPGITGRLFASSPVQAGLTETVAHRVSIAG
jgi:anti-sigma factor RsiW